MKLKVVEDIKKKIEVWVANKEFFEIRLKEAYSQGMMEASERSIETISSLSKKIEEHMRKNINDKETLAEEYEKKEKSNKEQYSKTIRELNDAHDNQCKFCRLGMQTEKTRLKTRQGYFSQSIDDIDLQWDRMYQYSGKMIDQAEIILKASAEMAASKAEFYKWKENIQRLIKDAQKYMMMGLQDSSTDVFISFEEKLDQHVIENTPKQIEKKDKNEGGLV